MSGEVNYKLKYQDLKSRYMEAVDLAFRLGFEDGMKQAQSSAAQQQQMQQQQPSGGMGDLNASQQANPNANDPDHPGGMDVAQPQETELDQHINQLEGMIKKSENISSADLSKMVASLRQSQELKKSAEAIKGISKALHTKGFNISAQTNHNMNTNAKETLGMQHKIVNDIMQKWETEEREANKEIKALISVEGLLKKE